MLAVLTCLYPAGMGLGDTADAGNAQFVAVYRYRFRQNTVFLGNDKTFLFQRNCQRDAVGGVCVFLHIGCQIVKDPAQLLHIEITLERGTAAQVSVDSEAVCQDFFKFFCQLSHQQAAVGEELPVGAFSFQQQIAQIPDLPAFLLYLLGKFLLLFRCGGFQCGKVVSISQKGCQRGADIMGKGS